MKLVTFIKKINIIFNYYKMDEQEEFLSFNKVIVFGDNGAVKTTLINFFEKGSFQEQIPTEYKLI